MKHPMGHLVPLLPSSVMLLLLPLFIITVVSLANALQNGLNRQNDPAFSDPVYPSPWMNPEALGWEDAYAKAKDFVSQLTLLEKVNLTTGVG